MDKAILDLSEKDFVVGLSYVGVTKIKKIDGTMFTTDFGGRAGLLRSEEGEAGTTGGYRGWGLGWGPEFVLFLFLYGWYFFCY